MGNFISWTKEKKSAVEKVNEQVSGMLRKEPNFDASRLQAGKNSGKHSSSQEQVSFSEGSFFKKAKSSKLYDKQDTMIHSDIKNIDDENWKSNSENVQYFMQSKLLNKVKCKSSKGQKKSTSSDAKRNQSLFRMRQSSLTRPRRQFRNGKYDCREVHPVSSQGREIIQSCFGNHHNEIGYRICMRVFEKRPDYQRFVHALGKERWLISSTELRDYLNNVVSKVSLSLSNLSPPGVNDVAAVEEISRQYGEQHVSLKKYGFKPDFWVSIADAMTVECVILDMANHQPTETVLAWSQLTSLMFASIRDGYYEALRFQRQTLKSNKRSTSSN
uniref:Globin family profile domain-containing protein n=1 Tax=Setaria digitata TaxID=48799 RepID=A0A915PD90_9BILA